MVLVSKNSPFRKVAAVASILLASSLSFTDAFVPPKTFANNHRFTITLPNESSPRHHRPIIPLNAILPIDTTAAIATTISSSTLTLSDDLNSSLELLKNVIYAITSVVVGFLGLTFFTINFVIPKAAEQLEADTNRLRPGLWEEYQAKLGEGETMATRPDLLQELGNVMKPLVMDSYEASATAKRSDGEKGGKGGGTTDGGESGAAPVKTESPKIFGDGDDQWSD